jgi:uncharacterized OB-fold protein
MTRYLGECWMLPGPDALTKRFFSAGELVFQQCAKCAHMQHPPTDVCGARRSRAASQCASRVAQDIGDVLA